MSYGLVSGVARRVASSSTHRQVSAAARSDARPARGGESRSMALAEGLERRTMLAAFVVNDVGDSGPGTLRQAILDANTTVGADTITFNIPSTDAVRTIRPLSPLPEVTGQTTIDAKTVAGQIIELDGSFAGPTANGLTVSGSTSVIRGLVINRFGGHGVAIGPTFVNGRPGPTPSGIRLEQNYIGTDWTGNVDLGNGGAGVVVSANGTVIGQGTNSATAPSARNVISGNGYAGIWVAPIAFGGSFQGPTIAGNYIGTNAAGSRPLGNGREGVLLEAGSNPTIGGTALPSRNLISGNASSGIRLGGTVTSQVRIVNNYIGTDFAGANVIPNGWSSVLPFHDGITVATTSTNFIGIGAAEPSTPTSTSRNLISGNAGAGVNVVSGGEVHVLGNYIGTDATGNADLGNGSHGVALQGSTTSAAFGRVNGNLISGNGGDGVHVGAAARLAVPIGGNYIGTNVNGTAALGNDGNGIGAEVSAIPLQIGTPVVSPPVANPPAPVSPTGTGRNLISANGGDGIRVIAEPRTSRPLSVFGNYIGTDVTGTVPLGNGGSGVYLAGGGNSVLGQSPPTSGGNLISANGGNGITLVGTVGGQQTSPGGTQVVANRIGTAALDPRVPSTQPDPGTNAGLGNHGHGIAIYYSSNNRIGNTTPTSANVIAYNDGSGVLVEGSPVISPSGNSAVGNQITGNSIYGNGRLGIDLVGAGEGVTPNDERDADTGANQLQNFPNITEAVANATGTSVQIRFTLMTSPGTYRVELFSSPLPDPSGYGEGRTFLGVMTVSTDANGAASGTFLATTPAGQATALYYTATAAQPTTGGTSEFSPAVRGTVAPPPPNPQSFATVTGRSVFYNDSAFDGNDPAGNTQDMGAIAPDKQAMLPGQTPSFKNVTSYDKGINGIQLMLTSLDLGHPALTADDFEFAAGGGATGGEWAAAPAPSAVTIIPVPGPNSVYSITWAGGAVRNAWLRVTVKANANTNLASPDVFYFGNLVGEVGDALSPLHVGAADLGAVKAHLNADAGNDSPYDINRDGVVNALDLGAVRANYGRGLAPVVVTPPVVTVGTSADPLEEPITQQVLQ